MPCSVCLPIDEREGEPDMGQVVAQDWPEFRDPREDIYTPDDGNAIPRSDASNVTSCVTSQAHTGVMQPQGFAFNPPKWNGESVQIAELWRLTKGTHIAICMLVNHPIGAEVRCTVDGEMKETQARRELIPLLDFSVSWKAAFEAAGWPRS